MLTDVLPGRSRVFLSFLWHCLHRALLVRRLMLQIVSFDEMLFRLSPLAASQSTTPEQIPEGTIVILAELFSCLFPRLWRRRCLFRSLLILDWSRQHGIDPTLNVGVELGESRDQGHCWLSLDGRPFCESGGWPARYSVLFHQGRKIQHWTSLAPASPDTVASTEFLQQGGRKS